MIVVTGASGHLGRRTVEMLIERVDASRVLALSRTPEKISDLGVTTDLADFDDPERLVTVFDGAERVLILSTPFTDTSQRRIRQHANAIQAAARAGVGHLLYTSIAQATDHGHSASVAVDHAATEAVLAGSGLPFTVLRNSQYTELLMMGAPTAVATGVLLDNCGDGATSYVTRDDCAEVAATVLADGGYLGERLEVTGPRAVTMAEVAALLTEYTGVSVRYAPVSDEDTVAELVKCGMAEPAATRLATIGRSIREGYTCVVSDVVRRVTGHNPTSVAQFLAESCAAAFRARGRAAVRRRVVRRETTG